MLGESSLAQKRPAQRRAGETRLQLILVPAVILTLGLAAQAVIPFFSDPVYEAGTTVEVAAEDMLRGSVFDEGHRRDDKLVAELLSSQLSEKVIATLGLQGHEEFSNLGFPWEDMRKWFSRRPTAGKPRDVTKLVQATYFERLSVRSLAGRTIDIRFTSADPRLAQAVVRQLAQYARDSVASERETETVPPDPRMEALHQELVRAVAARETLRSKDATGSRQTGNEGQLQAASDEHERVSAERLALEAQLRAAYIQLQSGTGHALLDARGSALARNLIESRASLRQHVATLSKTLPADSPRLRDANVDLASLDKQIADQAGLVVRQIQALLAQTQAREADAARNVRDQKSRADRHTADAKRLADLDAVITKWRSELSSLPAPPTIVSRPVAPQSPAAVPVLSAPLYPYRKRLWIGTIGLALLGIAIAAAAQWRSRRCQSVSSRPISASI